MKKNKFIIIVISILTILLLLCNYYDSIKIWILNRIIVQRGILSPNCPWYKISDLVLDDGAGVDLYNDYKKKYGDFAPSTMFNEKIYIVTNVNHIKTILDNSPDIFSVGKLKQQFFHSFMSKNVGVSSGCPWKRRREMNEKALLTDQLHVYSEKYNQDIYHYLQNWKHKKYIKYRDFLKFGKYIVAKVVFNTDNLHEDVFKVFSEANTIQMFSNENFKINPKVYQNYLNILDTHIDQPNMKSLIHLCVDMSSNKEEVRHQIPHFIFPLVATCVSVIPRLLTLILNDKKIVLKVKEEINSMSKKNDKLLSQKINDLSFIRKCIMESLRLNNVVITTFRTLTQDFSFDSNYHFKKGTQFLILNNPVLREKEYFKDPNAFIPERWTNSMEKSYYAISFNQGPQRCPAKELVIFLAQSFIYNFFLLNDVHKIKVKKMDLSNVPQVLNPCTIKFKL